MFNARLYAGNVLIAVADAWWPDACVAAEVDSREWHLSAEQWEQTMRRHARMTAQGILVLHFTPKQIRTEPAQVVAALRAALDAGGQACRASGHCPRRADPARDGSVQAWHWAGAGLPRRAHTGLPTRQPRSNMATPAIDVQHLTKNYGPVLAVDDVVSGEPGELVGFLGPNGAGKSTCMRILTTWLPRPAGMLG